MANKTGYHGNLAMRDEGNCEVRQNVTLGFFRNDKLPIN